VTAFRSVSTGLRFHGWSFVTRLPRGGQDMASRRLPPPAASGHLFTQRGQSVQAVFSRSNAVNPACSSQGFRVQWIAPVQHGEEVERVGENAPHRLGVPWM